MYKQLTGYKAYTLTKEICYIYFFNFFYFFKYHHLNNKRKVSKKGIVKATHSYSISKETYIHIINLPML